MSSGKKNESYVMYIFFSGETQSQKVMIVNREEVNARCYY